MTEQCFKHDFDDPDPTDEYKVQIYNEKYHEVIGEQCKKCDVVKLCCFKKENETLGEPDDVYELTPKQIAENMK